MAQPRIDPRGARLLVVDDDHVRRQALTASLAIAGYSGVTAVELAGVSAAHGSPAPDLVVLDLDAAERAAQALTAIRVVFGPGAELPVLGLTSDASAAGRTRCAALDVQDFATRPLGQEELRMRVDNALGAGRLRRLLGQRSAQLTEALRERTAELDTVRESLSVLAAMADYQDDDTDHHAQRVGEVASRIAAGLGLREPFVEMLRDAAPLHDVGKVGISRRILLKPGKLTAAEWVHVQSHVDVGAQILASSSSPVLLLAAEIARTHHERFDGSGYTGGLAGEEIPLSGRIVAVADVWDTLTHHRPYRPAWEPARALDEIHSTAGSHFDPRIVETFITLGPETMVHPPVEVTHRAA